MQLPTRLQRRNPALTWTTSTCLLVRDPHARQRFRSGRGSGAAVARPPPLLRMAAVRTEAELVEALGAERVTDGRDSDEVWRTTRGGEVALADGAVIELTGRLEITVDTTIRGGGAIGEKLLEVYGATLKVSGITCAGLAANGDGQAAGSTRLEAIDVRVLNSESSGIFVGYGATGSIVGGSVEGSGFDGVRVQGGGVVGGGATVSLSHVAISNGGSNGIAVYNGGTATVDAECTVSGSGEQDYNEDGGGTIERVAAAPLPDAVVLAVAVPDAPVAMATPVAAGAAGPPALLMAIDAGRLALGEEIGAGANGTVFRATLSRGGQSTDVAMKMMPGLVAAQERAAFDQELDALVRAAAATDGGVTRLFGTCLKAPAPGQGERLCIVMKLYPSTLARALREHPGGGGLPPQRILKYMWQLSATLSQLHEQGILHRDLKPENLLLTAADDIKIGDFGISKIVQSTLGARPTSVAGTFNYMSPEAIDPTAFDGRVTAAADVWSLGACLAEMVTGSAPFDGMQMMQIGMAVMRHRTPEFPADSPFAPLLADVFAFQPERRPTAAQILAGRRRRREAAGAAGRPRSRCARMRSWRGGCRRSSMWPSRRRRSHGRRGEHCGRRPRWRLGSARRRNGRPRRASRLAGRHTAAGRAQAPGGTGRQMRRTLARSTT